MAGLSLDVSTNVRELNSLIRQFPSLSAGVFSYIGKQGRLTLKGRLLSGQELNLKKFPVDKAGRHTISSHVIRGVKGVVWTSYPLNLFEKGRILRSGRKEPGRKILTGKLKTLVASELQKWGDDAKQKIFDPEIKRV